MKRRNNSQHSKKSNRSVDKSVLSNRKLPKMDNGQYNRDEMILFTYLP